MIQTQSASQQITHEMTSWPGVEARAGRRGEWAFQVGRREISHVHGEHAAHFSFPKQVWAELSQQGRITEHPVFPVGSDRRHGGFMTKPMSMTSSN